MKSFKQNLISLFYNTLKPDPPKERKPDTFNVKPSEVGSKCMRKIYYGTFKVPKDFDVAEDIKKMGKMGDGLGTILSNAYRNEGILIDYANEDGSVPIKFGAPNQEFPISCPELGIKSGFIDGVYIMNGELWLGEYKSCTDKAFPKLRKPKPPHLEQAIIYLFVFNKLLKEGKYKHIKALDGFTEAKGMRFVYVDRNNMVHFLMKEYVYTIEEAKPIFAKTVEKITKLLEFTDRKELPPKTPDWCQSCPWRAKCAKNYNID